MQFCTRCGRYVSEQEAICPECGAVLRHEVIIDCGPYRYRFPVFFISLIVFAAFSFWAIFALDVYIFFFFIPFIFFRGDSSGPFRYIAMGMTMGVGIGLIAAWIYRYSGLF